MVSVHNLGTTGVYVTTAVETIRIDSDRVSRYPGGSLEACAANHRGLKEDHMADQPRRWGFVLGIIIVIALVVLMVLLHLTGTLGPGVH
jgi:hypothetical protein